MTDYRIIREEGFKILLRLQEKLEEVKCRSVRDLELEQTIEDRIEAMCEDLTTV
jgi:hypothetical protein